MKSMKCADMQKERNLKIRIKYTLNHPGRYFHSNKLITVVSYEH